MFTPEEQARLDALKADLRRQGRTAQFAVYDDGIISRARSVLDAQSESDDWYASRPQGEGMTLSPEQAETRVAYQIEDPDGVIDSLPHGGVISGHLSFMQWDADGTLVVFGLVVDGAEYIVQPVDPEADGDEEDDES